MSKPIEGNYPTYFSQYISKVPEENLAEAFKNQQEIIADFFSPIPEIKWDFAYAPGKWTLKELLQHMIDTERIFAYRSLCIARKETQSLPGFNENEYAANSYAHTRNWHSLVEELKMVRQTTEMLFNSFPAEILNQSGVASNNPVTVNALGFISVGHIYHHLQVIKEKYI
jgi:hypothetical protein